MSSLKFYLLILILIPKLTFAGFIGQWSFFYNTIFPLSESPVVNSYSYSKMDNAILVNTGQFLERWSNKRFRATPHRVIPPKDVDRYSFALFVNTAFEPKCECLPTCTSSDNPPQYKAESYYEFYTWYMNNTYPHYEEFHGENPK